MEIVEIVYKVLSWILSTNIAIFYYALSFYSYKYLQITKDCRVQNSYRWVYWIKTTISFYLASIFVYSMLSNIISNYSPLDANTFGFYFIRPALLIFGVSFAISTRIKVKSFLYGGKIWNNRHL